ncbi:MAG: glycosyltransferase family 2 protein [Actinobacteria bacterium]|nr:glycosyltransferase family 2 protein [Actinomycetota bacterium]MBM3711958.1 glycosyltransferase family 2 protein [Actinomycetota bacterium]
MDLNGFTVFIIVVTYNSSNFIEKCLDSLNINGNKNCFFVIIDNNSADDTEDKICGFIKSYKIGESNFKFIRLKRNTGFAAAVNYAVFNFLIKEKPDISEKIKYLILINPDIIVEDNSISDLVKTFESGGAGNLAAAGKPVGVAGGLIYEYDRNEIQHAGGDFKSNLITYHMLNKMGQIYSVSYVTGALFATEFSLFKNLRGFDSGYRPAYFEELDYCFKVNKMGYIVAVNTEATARHYGAASVKKFSPEFFKYYHKNRIRCAIMHLSLAALFRKFLPAELKWLKNESTKEQYIYLLYSYFLNFLFLPYNLIIRFKNYLEFCKLASEKKF